MVSYVYNIQEHTLQRPSTKNLKRFERYEMQTIVEHITTPLNFFKASTRADSRAQFYFIWGHVSLRSWPWDPRPTSKNAGTQNRRVEFVASAPSKTLSGVEITGGKVGGKQAIVRPENIYVRMQIRKC